MLNQYNNRPTRQAIIPIGPSIAYIPMPHNVYALIDSEDAEFASSRNWSCHTKKFPYPVSGRGKNRVFLHLLLGSKKPNKRDKDHKNTNVLDNRKSNLRVATRSQNLHNSKARSHSSHGFKGVSKAYKTRYSSRIWINGKRICLGSSFHTPELAHAAYAKKLQEIDPKFARTE